MWSWTAIRDSGVNSVSSCQKLWRKKTHQKFSFVYCGFELYQISNTTFININIHAQLTLQLYVQLIPFTVVLNDRCNTMVNASTWCTGNPPTVWPINTIHHDQDSNPLSSDQKHQRSSLLFFNSSAKTCHKFDQQLIHFNRVKEKLK